MKNRFSKSTLVGAMATLALVSTPAIASDLGVSGHLGGRLTVDTNIKDGSASSKVSNAEIKGRVELNEGLRVLIGLELADAIGGSVEAEDLKKIVEQAEIQMDIFKNKVTGENDEVATLTFGKGSIAYGYGEEFSQMAIPENDQRYALQRNAERMHITVKLPKNALGMISKAVDSVEVSVFEDGAGDFKFSDDKGVSVRATKAFSDKLEATLSAMYIDRQESESGDNDEARLALGISYESESGWKFWAEGEILDNNPTYPDADFAASVGASKKVGPGTLVLMGSVVDQYGEQLAASYHLPISKVITISGEVRYDTETEETNVGVRTTISGASISKKLK